MNIIERLEDDGMYIFAIDDAIKEIKILRSFYSAAKQHLTKTTFDVIVNSAVETYIEKYVGGDLNDKGKVTRC